MLFLMARVHCAVYCDCCCLPSHVLLLFDPNTLEAFTACRLIPLDKNPGVHPIGIGEMLRRLVSKCVLTVAHDEMTRVCGTMELCAGQCAGAEAAIHAVSDLFNRDDTEAALFVDASNAFNSLNRAQCLHFVPNAVHFCYQRLPHAFPLVGKRQWQDSLLRRNNPR